MKRPIFAKEFTVEEKQIINKTLSSKDGFSLRRAQILRLSGDQQKIPREIAHDLGCSVQMVRGRPDGM